MLFRSPTPAPFLAAPPSSRPAVSQSPRRLGGSTHGQDAARPRRRSESTESGGRILRAKKNISPHSLRHAYATHLVEAGVELTEVQRILGHHSILTTVRYTHLTDQTRHHAIERINALMDGYRVGKGTPR